MRLRTVLFLGVISTALGFTDRAADDPVMEVGVAAGDLVPGDTLDPAWCPVPGDAGAGVHLVRMEHGGLTRSYEMHVPASYDSAVPAPLVVSLHGFASSAGEHAALVGLDGVAELEGFLAVYPSGFESTWNAGTCCGPAAVAGIDDVGFVVEMVRDVATRLCVDTERIYLTGVSNGQDMAHRIAWERPGIFAAVATVSTDLPGTAFVTALPVPTIVLPSDGEAVDPLLSWIALRDDPDMAWRMWSFLSEYSL